MNHRYLDTLIRKPMRPVEADDADSSESTEERDSRANPNRSPLEKQRTRVYSGWTGSARRNALKGTS
jgi:hypothetical protein